MRTVANETVFGSFISPSSPKASNGVPAMFGGGGGFVNEELMDVSF